MSRYLRMTAYEREESFSGFPSRGLVEFRLHPIFHCALIPRLTIPCFVDLCNIGNRRINSSGDSRDENVPAYTNMDSPLLQPPNELLLAIGKELDLNSIYTLTQCCVALRIILFPEVIKRFCAGCAPWANTPLICCRSGMRTNPSGITAEVPKGFRLV